MAHDAIACSPPPRRSRLAKRIERGDLAAKREMIERNLRLVHSLAQRYRGRGAPYGISCRRAPSAWLRAVEKFDHRRGLKFSTYAIWSIRRSLADAVVDARTIRIPSNASHRLARIHRAEHELERLGVRLTLDRGDLRADRLQRPQRAARCARRPRHRIAR